MHAALRIERVEALDDAEAARERKHNKDARFPFLTLGCISTQQKRVVSFSSFRPATRWNARDLVDCAAKVILVSFALKTSCGRAPRTTITMGTAFRASSTSGRAMDPAYPTRRRKLKTGAKFWE